MSPAPASLACVGDATEDAGEFVEPVSPAPDRFGRRSPRKLVRAVSLGCSRARRFSFGPDWAGLDTYHELEPKPTEKAEDAPALSSYRRLVIFYAVVSDEIEQVIESSARLLRPRQSLGVCSETNRTGVICCTSSR
jgi:hypothetical protein